MSYDVSEAAAALLHWNGCPADGYDLLKAGAFGGVFKVSANYGIGGVKQVSCPLADLEQIIGAFRADPPGEYEPETFEDDAPDELQAEDPGNGEPEPETDEAPEDDSPPVEDDAGSDAEAEANDAGEDEAQPEEGAAEADDEGEAAEAEEVDAEAVDEVESEDE
jgi:hypothetical protein